MFRGPSEAVTMCVAGEIAVRHTRFCTWRESESHYPNVNQETEAGESHYPNVYQETEAGESHCPNVYQETEAGESHCPNVYQYQSTM